MAEFVADLRDLKFALLEQLEIEKLLTLPRFRELDVDTLTHVIDEAYKLARNQMAPMNVPADRKGAVYDRETSEVRVPPQFHETYKIFTEGGWLALTDEPAYGGQGMPRAVEVAVGDLLFGSCLSFNLLPLLTTGTAHLIQNFGTEEMKHLYVEKLLSGRWAGTMCLTEPHAGSDVGAGRTKARRNGDHYLIEGDKIFITYGEHDLTENICHTVLARVEGAPAGTRGLSLFLVPKRLVERDGSLGERNDVRCTSIEHKMGIHGSPTCTMVFGERGQCRGYLLGAEGKGMRAMFQLMNEARIMVGQQGAALANAAYQYALAWAKERVQGRDLTKGKEESGEPGVTIIHHPDVKRMLLWQKALTEGCRALMLRTAYFFDLAHATDDPGERDRAHGLAELLTPVCKAYCSDMGFRSIELSMQVLGGYGYIADYPIEQYMRDAKIASIYEGTNGIQAADLVGRKLPANGGQSLRDLVGMMTQLAREHASHPALAAEMGLLKSACAALADVSLHLAKVAPTDMRLPALHAVPYLQLLGKVALGWLLLEAAAIAHPRLAAIAKAKGVVLSDTGALTALVRDDDEAKYFDGKIKAARFYAQQALALVRAEADALKADDRSALEVTF